MFSFLTQHLKVIENQYYINQKNPGIVVENDNVTLRNFKDNCRKRKVIL